MAFRLFRLAVLGSVLGATLAVGSAAGLPFGTDALSAGSAPVTDCGASGVAVVTYDADTTGAVTAVVVDSLPASCDGGRISATLVGSTGPLATGGPVAVATAPALTTIAVSPPVPSTDVVGTDLVIVGP